MSRLDPRALFGGSVCCLTAALGAVSDRAADDHFEQQVLPLLRRSCFECHGPEQGRAKGGLRMDGRDALLRGGESGPAIVPGDPDASLLVRAVRYEDPVLEMPPDGRLAAEEIGILERWVELGAPWPEGLVRTKPDHEAVRFFEEEVRPVLAKSCHECHGPQLETTRSGLRMTGPGLLLGGERGPALVPGDPEASLVVHAVRGTHAELVMPPSGDRLTEDEIRALERWIELGAPWPSYGEAELEPLGGREIDLAEGRLWWSFRPVERPAVPDVERDDLARTPIDAFVLARLADAGLERNPAASPRELVRRAYFDLIGLPPTFEEVERFAADPSDEAWERLIDGLLARPEYGERWGRRWLDVVRYAETNGYERDGAKPNAWRYRDYVVRAFNEDKPYDRFVLEQLAGDELDAATDDALIATGFYRLGVWDDEPDDAHQAVYDELDDIVRTIGEGLMGLTIGCARCHDHKFDPLRQEDYYSTLAFVRNVRPYENPRHAEDSATMRLLGSAEAVAAWRAERDGRIAEWEAGIQAIRRAGRDRVVRERLPDLPEEVRELYLTPPEERTQEWQDRVASTPELHADRKTLRAALEPEEVERVVELLRAIAAIEESFAGDLDWALAVNEFGPTAPATHVLIRGRAASRGEEVEPRFVPVLCADDEASVPALPEPGPDAASSGRRRALAEWIVDPAHPLAARVLVNRVWQGHFGRALVPTPNDFGSTGAPPTHPELLDWLAAELVARGWSIKELHRVIMRSAAYRMSSRATNPTAVERDPANELLWRQDMTRLDAEAIRDSVLAVGGTLESRGGGPSFFPELSRQALGGGYRPGKGWGASSADEENRRSLYAYVKRTTLVPLFETFDFANPALPSGARATTTIPNQALTLLNSDFMNAEAAAFAARVRAAGGDTAERVTRAFELALARRPTPEELRIAAEYVERQGRSFADARPLLTFEPRVPPRLDGGYLEVLPARRMLHGPDRDWLYVKGEWGAPYNGTLAPEGLRGPAALYGPARFADAVIEARVRLREGCELGALVLRARPADEVLEGLQVVLDPVAGRVRLACVGAETPAGSVVADEPAGLEPERWHELHVALAGPRVCVRLDGNPVLDVEDARFVGEGGLGLFVVGGAIDLDEVTIRTADGVVTVPPDEVGTPEERALESLCLTLLNLNEFVYVD